MVEPKHLRLAFENREELLDALLWDLHPPGLVAPEQNEPLVVGERVRVQVGVPEHGSVFVSGLVIWRRVTGIPGGRPGVGIRFGPDAHAWMALVEASAPASRERSHPVAFVVENEAVLHEGLLMDIGRRSARLSTAAAPAADLVVALRLRPPKTSPVVAARVTRSAGSDAWLELLSERPSVLRFWEGLVRAP